MPIIGIHLIEFNWLFLVRPGSEITDDQKDEWMSPEEEVTIKSIPSEGDFQYSRGSGVCPPPELSTLLLFDSSLVGFRKKL